MFVPISNLRDFIFWETGWNHFILFLFILDWIIRLFRKEGK